MKDTYQKLFGSNKQNSELEAELKELVKKAIDDSHHKTD